MRLAGKSYRAIGEGLRLSGERARQLVAEAIGELGIREKAEQLLELELARLDRIQEAVFAAAINGDTRAAVVVLRVMERRSRLVGLDRVPREAAERAVEAIYEDMRADADEVLRRIALEAARLAAGGEAHLYAISAES